jgi:site-specific DNA-methyltransferase (adenine-specific)
MNEIVHGDCLDILPVIDVRADLIYLDPPFFTNRFYGNEELGFDDRWDNRDTYIEWIKLRVLACYKALKPTGSFYLHCDPTASHYLKVVLDSIFCSNGGQFQNEIIWTYKTGGASKKRFARKHDVIFFYTKSSEWTFNIQMQKSFLMHNYGFGTSDIRIDEKTKQPYTMVYARDVFEISSVGSENSERLNYPTQKPEALLRRIIEASSNEGDVVFDPMCGSGTTIAVAKKLNRKYLGIDISEAAVALANDRINHPQSDMFLEQPQNMERINGDNAVG